MSMQNIGLSFRRHISIEQLRPGGGELAGIAKRHPRQAMQGIHAPHPQLAVIFGANAVDRRQWPGPVVAQAP